MENIDKNTIEKLRGLALQHGGLMFVQSEQRPTDAGIGIVKTPEYNTDGTLKYPELVYYCKLDGFYNWKKVIGQ